MFILLTTHKKKIERLECEIETLKIRNAKLKAQLDKTMLELIKAKKNDTPKDPKTGKFTKKK